MGVLASEQTNKLAYSPGVVHLRTLQHFLGGKAGRGHIRHSAQYLNTLISLTSAAVVRTQVTQTHIELPV